MLRRAFVSLSVTVLVFPSSDRSLSLPLLAPPNVDARASSPEAVLLRAPPLRRARCSSRCCGSPRQQPASSSRRQELDADDAIELPLSPLPPPLSNSRSFGRSCPFSLLSVPGPRGQARCGRPSRAKGQQREASQALDSFKRNSEPPRKKKKTAIEKTKTLALVLFSPQPLSLFHFFLFSLSSLFPLLSPSPGLRRLHAPRRVLRGRGRNRNRSRKNPPKNPTTATDHPTKTRPWRQPACSRSKSTRPRPRARPLPRRWASPPSSEPSSTPSRGPRRPRPTSPVTFWNSPSASTTCLCLFSSSAIWRLWPRARPRPRVGHRLRRRAAAADGRRGGRADRELQARAAGLCRDPGLQFDQARLCRLWRRRR